MRLESKVAIVTGGASGMGASTAKIFAREGCKVVVADQLDDGGKKIAGEIVAANGAASFHHLDVTNEANWKMSSPRQSPSSASSTSWSTMPGSAAARSRICSTPPPGTRSWTSTRAAPFLG